MTCRGASYAATPRRAAAVFVAFESLTYRTPRSSRTSSSLCGTPGNVRSASAIASSSSPEARAASVAAAAFSRLCSPGISGSAGSGSCAENSIPSRPSPRGTTFTCARSKIRSFASRYASNVPWRSRWSGVEVEQHGHLARERLDVLELEARQLAHDPRAGLDGERHLAERSVLVAGEHGVFARGGEHGAEQPDGGRLPLRAGDPDHRVAGQEPPAELDLAPERNAARQRRRGERRAHRNAGALHHQIDSRQHRLLLRPEAQFDIRAREPPGVGVGRAVGDDDLHAARREGERCRLAGDGEPEDERTAREPAHPSFIRLPGRRSWATEARGRPPRRPRRPR